MARRAPLTAAFAIGGVVVVTALAIRVGGASGPTASPTIATGTAPVARTTITSRQQVNGTLGYGATTTIAAPTGVSPEQVAQAQSATNAASVALHNARDASSESTAVANAQSALSSLSAGYATAKTNARSQMDAAYSDTRAFRAGLDAVFAGIDAALNEPPRSGSDWHGAMVTLNAAVTPISNARNLAGDLVGGLGGYQQARDGLDVAVAGFDGAFASGSDTAVPSAAFGSARITYDAAAARITSGLDSATAPLAQVTTAVVSAQSFLNSPTSRYDIGYDALRSDLAKLLATVANAQQLARTAESELGRVATELGTVQSAIGGSLVAARQSVASANAQAAQAQVQSAAQIASAQQQLNSAATQLASARAGQALGSGTYTWLPSLNVTIGRGDRLYAVDGRPIPLFFGATPMYRRIAEGMSGDDVVEVEANLRALGFAVSDDGRLEADDIAALRAWQASLGMDATGDLPIGAVVMLPGSARVVALHATVGSPYLPGQPVVDVTDTSHVVTVALDATLQANVKIGDTVSVQLPNTQRVMTGKVAAIAPVAQAANNANQQQGQLRATVTLTVTLDDPSAGGTLDQAPVRVSIVDQIRTNVLAVPVTSLVARSDGTFFVRVVHGSQRDDVTVKPGIFGDSGLVEVTATGLNVGDQVEVPKSP